MHECRAYNLGLVEYQKALELQNRLVAERIAGEIPDTILFLQHPPVITIGRTGSEENILVPKDLLTAEGISVYHTDRGGDVTVHCPGQMVVYLILDLKPRETGLHQFVRSLEEIAIQTLQSYSITSQRDSRYPGVWAGQEKICALGVRVSRWVTKHGLALNVNNGLKYFSYINPCGIRDRKVTSISRILHSPVPMEEVASIVLEQCSRVFGTEIKLEPAEGLYSYAR